MTPVNTKMTEMPGAHFQSLSARIRNIRESAKLTREQFSERAGVNIHTIKAVEQKGVVPGGEVLVKIAFAFPEYALWLITESTQRVGGHLSPENGSVGDCVAMTIIDKFDPRSPEDCAVKVRALSGRAIFITNEDAVDIACAIPVSTRIGEAGDVVWARSGSLSLTSERPNVSTSSFIAWLKDVGIERFDLKCIAGQLGKTESYRVVWESQIIGGELLEGKRILEARKNLNKWCK